MSISLRNEDCECILEHEDPCKGGSLYIPIEYVSLNSSRTGKEYEDLMYVYLKKTNGKMNEFELSLFSQELESVNPSLLYPTQYDVEADAVQRYARNLEASKINDPLLAARFDNSNYTYIMDGHHRFVAHMIVSGRSAVSCLLSVFSRNLVA